MGLAVYGSSCKLEQGGQLLLEIYSRMEEKTTKKIRWKWGINAEA